MSQNVEIKFRDISNTYNIRFISVYRRIIDVILHLFVICYDLRCQLPFFKRTFCHNRSAVFSKIPQMCCGCLDVHKCRGQMLRFWNNFGLSCWLNRLYNSTQRVTKDGVPLFANLFNWRVRWPLPAIVPLFSLGLKVPRSPCGHSGRLLTRYRPCEVRNSIYWYRKIHINYRSKFSYRFISSILIIYGNTNNDLWPWPISSRSFSHDFAIKLLKYGTSCVLCIIYSYGWILSIWKN